MIFDAIVTGSGAAGLAMVNTLIQSAQWKEKKIAVIDKDLYNPIPKTWCFWDKIPLQGVPIKHQWSSIVFARQGRKYQHSLKDQRYFEVQSTEFHAAIFDAIQAHPNVFLIQDAVVAITNTGYLCNVECALADYQAVYVFNSIPNVVQQLPHFSLTQNFVGLRIKTSGSHFDPDVVTLMDFEHDESSFIYVLPYDDNEALIEFTRLTENLEHESYYVEQINKYLSKNFGVTDYHITYKEKGAIPMSDFAYDPNPLPNVYQIGTVGGNTKSTTGYTFKNTFYRCGEIIGLINSHAQLQDKSQRFIFYDRLLLHIIIHQPNQLPRIMEALFKRTKIETLLAFLDERTMLYQEVGIFLRLPWAPFLKALFSKKSTLYESTTSISDNVLLRHTV